MAPEELCSPIPEISIDAKRRIPEFLLEEQMAVERLRTPEIKRPIRPMYAFVRNFTPDLTPHTTTPGIDMWAEFRLIATGESNYSLWSEELLVNDEKHTVALHSVRGETPEGTPYHHNTLRCSCCLPDYRSNQDLEDEYAACPAKDLVIGTRVPVYKKILGTDQVNKFNNETLRLVNDNLDLIVVSFLGFISSTSRIFPPSDRSDRLPLGRAAEVLDVPQERIQEVAQELEHNQVIQLHGEKFPSMSLAA